MKPLADFPRSVAARVRGVLTDIDDTLTDHGKLTADAYTALERLKTAGFAVIPVTGRPAGWCDHIARMWPVDAVVGENGAFYFAYDRARHRMQQRFVVAADEQARRREQLAAIAKEALAAFPGTALASDQPYRLADIAIDYCEDVPPLPRETATDIATFLQSRGLTAKVSSIHVNAWLGVYDKLTCARLLLDEHFGVAVTAPLDEWIFVGDSPNDAPMFAAFPYAVGVANVKQWGAQLTTAPAYVTQSPGGRGFVELADLLIASRNG